MPHAEPDVDNSRSSLPETIAEEVKREMQVEARATLRKKEVPDQYRILAHPDDYDWLRPVKEDLLKEINEELDEVLVELNEGTNYWLELVDRISRIPMIGPVLKWFARPFVPEEDKTYEVSGPWHVEIDVSGDVAQGNVQIDGYFPEESEKPPPGNGNGDTEGIPKPDGSESSGNGNDGTKTSPHKTISTTIENVLGSNYAVLTYPNEDGETEIFEMKKEKVKVGRGDMYVDLHLDFVEKDISREHLHVRCNPDTDRIEVKDVSKYGTSINGTTIDEKEWHPISDGARIVLAGRDDVPIDVEISSE